MNEICKKHRILNTVAEAEEWRQTLIRRAKKSGKGGKSYKRLQIFSCGDHLHVGRANDFTYRGKRNSVKPPSPGALRRKAMREAKAMRRYVDRLVRQCLRDRIRDILAE